MFKRCQIHKSVILYGHGECPKCKKMMREIKVVDPVNEGLRRYTKPKGHLICTHCGERFFNEHDALNHLENHCVKRYKHMARVLAEELAMIQGIEKQ